jgi:hypothetical protein
MNTDQFTRISKKAFWLIVGNDEHSWRDYKSNETHEWTIYEAHGLQVMALCNWSNEVTYWFIGASYGPALPNS